MNEANKKLEEMELVLENIKRDLEIWHTKVSELEIQEKALKNLIEMSRAGLQTENE